MMVLIIGGSGSGKSAYAEEYITKISKKCRKYYIATMQTLDGESLAKIERHQKMRNGKGFLTIEQAVNVEKALDKMEETSQKENAALLECISNLTANEMFSEEGIKNCNETVKKVVQGIERLNDKLKHLVIVTNNVFEDGRVYDESTMEYIRALGIINGKLADMAEQVIEVVVGIPVTVKEGKQHADY